MRRWRRRAPVSATFRSRSSSARAALTRSLGVPSQRCSAAWAAATGSEGAGPAIASSGAPAPTGCRAAREAITCSGAVGGTGSAVARIGTCAAAGPARTGANETASAGLACRSRGGLATEQASPPGGLVAAPGEGDVDVLGLPVLVEAELPVLTADPRLLVAAERIPRIDHVVVVD